MAVQSQDIASLFKELEDASKLAKLEEKNNKETTKKQVKELDSFLTSVQKVVKVIEKKDDDTPIKPKKVTPKVEKKSKPNGKVQEQSKKIETKSLSEDDTKKLDAFSGLIKSFGVEIKPEIVEEDLQLQVEDVKPVKETLSETMTLIKENNNVVAFFCEYITMLKFLPLTLETCILELF